jgi:hypothetical protein
MGYVDGFFKDPAGNFLVKGWVCIKGDTQSIAVHVYANGPYPSGQVITTGIANESSEPAVADACGTSGSSYRFLVPISPALQDQFSGAPLYVHAINNYDNPVLPSINGVIIPAAPVEIGPGPTVETWKVLEISLTSSLNYTNPFTDVEVNATFTGPGGIKISRPAFWDGGRVWKIRFAPTVPGPWSYVTTATQADDGLQEKSGTLNAIPYSGSQPIYRNGFLKSSGSHYLAYHNGTPFFWLGHDFTMIDAARLNKTNKFNWNPVPAHAGSQLYGMIENAALKQFNVLNFAFFSKWNQENGNSVADDLNVAKFKTLYDPAMEFAASQGFVVMLALGYREEMNMGVEANKHYARYLVARYGAYPVVWTVTEMDNPGYASEAPLWGEVFSYASSLDAYHQPMGPWYRQTALGSETPTLYLNQPWVSLIIHQCGHKFPGSDGSGGIQLSWKYQFYYDHFPQIPMVEAGGCNYEQIYAGVDDYIARRSAWRAILAGSSGFGYGAEGVWNMNWNEAHPTMNYGSQNLPWSVGIDLPGSWSMAYLKYFYATIPWHTMKPRNGKHSLVTWSNDGALTDMEKPLVRGDAGLRNVLIYIPKEFSSPGDSGGIMGLGGNSYLTKWFNPRNGETIIIDASMVPGAYGTWTIPKKPDGMDWVLQMTAQ